MMAQSELVKDPKVGPLLPVWTPDVGLLLCPWLLGPNILGYHLQLSALQAAWLQLGLYLVPVRPPRLGACLEACDGVLLLLLGQEVESHLQANGLHVILAQCRGHIHVQFQEAAYEVGGEGTLRGQLP